MPRVYCGPVYCGVDTVDSTKVLRQASLVVMTLQNTLLVIFMSYSRKPPANGEHMYVVTTAVVCSEALKFVSSLCLSLMSLSAHEIIQAMLSVDALMMLVPAGLYTLQNNLQYVAMNHLDVSIYQVLYQMKLVTTALFSVSMLGRSLSVRQWFGIVVCTLGIAIVQISSLIDKPAEKEGGGNSMIGFLAVTFSCVTSGLAGVYTEKVFKTSRTNMWVRNMQLALFSVAVGGAGVLVNDLELVVEKGFFIGYNRVVWTVIGLQAFGGIVVAVVVKYADNIAKGFSTGISIVVSCAISSLLFDFKMNTAFAAGAFCVLMSIGIYSCGNASAVSTDRKRTTSDVDAIRNGDSQNSVAGNSAADAPLIGRSSEGIEFVDREKGSE